MVKGEEDKIVWTAMMLHFLLANEMKRHDTNRTVFPQSITKLIENSYII